MNALIRIFIISFAFSIFLFAESRFKKEINANKQIDISSQIQITKQYGNKVDPMLRQLKVEYEEALSANKSVSEAFSAYEEIVAISLDYINTPFVQLLIESSSTAQTHVAIEDAGGFVTNTIGDILVASLPLESVESLAAKKHVQHIELNKINKSKLNQSHVEIGANLVHTGNGTPVPYTGTGVVLGAIDSGLDFSHPDFTTGGGIMRVKYLWDVSGQGNPPAGYNYGTEWTQAQMANGSATQIDGNGGGGHGTHVVGIAAGNNAAVSGYVGTAPEADIVFVKGIRDHNSSGGFTDGDVVNGVSYIFSKAAQMGQPAVVNLSLGGHYGPHDGTSLYEQALDGLTGPGKIIVAAGGNEGGSLRHVTYAAQSGSSYNDALETVWVADGSSPVSLVDMWYNTGSISVGLAAYDQYGSLLGFTNPVAPGQTANNINFDPGTGTGTLGIVSIDASVTSDPQNGASRVQVLIDSENGTWPITQVFWSLYTFGSGSLDAWVVVGGRFTTDSNSWFRPGDSETLIGIPGTANEIITVGSYVTKNQWVDLNGNVQTQPGNPTIGQISSFSSVGPTRDNRLKPEITAPGEAILAAVSTHLTLGVGVQVENVHQSGWLQKQQGTSMAAPHVAGVIALMLERNPNLDVATIKSILTNTARPVGSPNTTWGHGKIDALDAVNGVLTSIDDDKPVNAITEFELEQNYPNPFNPSTTISYKLPESSDVTLTVYNMLGQTVSVLVNETQPAGSYSTNFEASQLPSGIYYYRLEAGGTSNVRKMMLLK